VTEVERAQISQCQRKSFRALAKILSDCKLLNTNVSTGRTGPRNWLIPKFI